MTQKWNLTPPHLLISITGGNKNFTLKPQLKKAFREGLMKVAETAGTKCVNNLIHETDLAKLTGKSRSLNFD